VSGKIPRPTLEFSLAYEEQTKWEDPGPGNVVVYTICWWTITENLRRGDTPQIFALFEHDVWLPDKGESELLVKEYAKAHVLIHEKEADVLRSAIDVHDRLVARVREYLKNKKKGTP